MRKRALIGCMSHRAGGRRGDRRQTMVSLFFNSSSHPTRRISECVAYLRGAPSAISMAVIPQDHRSLCTPDHQVSVKNNSFQRVQF